MADTETVRAIVREEIMLALATLSTSAEALDRPYETAEDVSVALGAVDNTVGLAMRKLADAYGIERCTTCGEITPQHEYRCPRG